MTEVPFYARALDFEALWREFPPAADYVAKIHRLSRDELRSLQERRLLHQVRRAWEVPFYQRHWSKAGLRPDDIRSLGDFTHIPPYTVHDLRDSIDREPPWGDYMGLDESGPPMPLVLQTSGGTTGLPRPMLYSPRDREIMCIMSSRRSYLQGVRPFDRVQVALSLGLSNGGMLAREGLWRYTGAVPVMTGSGAATPTRRQVEIMKAWRINVLVAFPAYARHMAFVARDEMGIDPASLGIKAVLSHLGVDNREELEALWGGARVYDSYGTNECGGLAADCEYRQGMHVYEDAFIIEINDLDTLQPVGPGAKGTMFLTALFKHLAPVIRFNVNDVSAFLPGSCPCGGTSLRLDRIFGRSDNMVKLRGVNVFPEAIGALVAEAPACNGEYVCIVERVGRDEHEEMTVLVETATAEADKRGIEAALGARFKDALGLKIAVQAVDRGSLDKYTGLSQTSKIKRLIDQRKSV